MVGFSTLTYVVQHHHHRGSSTFLWPQADPVAVKLSLPPPHSAPAPDNHFLSRGFAPFTSHRWTHTHLLHLPSFCWLVYKVHPCWSICRYFSPFRDWVISHWMNICILFIHSRSIFFFLTETSKKFHKGSDCLSTNGATIAEYPKSKKKQNWTSILISLNTQITRSQTWI